MSAEPSTTRIVIPLRAFGSSKRRLAGVLDDRTRECLSRSMAQGVVGAAQGYATAIACDDDEVAAWAARVGADVIRTDGYDLNGSAELALADSSTGGWGRMAVVHADLPLVTTFEEILGGDGQCPAADEIVIVPDRRMTGTNLLVVPCGADFRFAYGPGSFDLHRREASRTGLAVRVITNAAFSWDVDEPEDLVIPTDATYSASTHDLLRDGILRMVDNADHVDTHVQEQILESADRTGDGR